MATDPSAYLAEIGQRIDAATPGPWWSDQDEDMYRLHGVMARVPSPFGGDQVVGKQIAKAAKGGTPYAEYWPDPADDEFITRARTDLPRLLAAVQAALGLADLWADEAGSLDARSGVTPDNRVATHLLYRAQGKDDAAKALRAAIAAALTGEAAADGV